MSCENCMHTQPHCTYMLLHYNMYMWVCRSHRERAVYTSVRNHFNIDLMSIWKEGGYSTLVKDVIKLFAIYIALIPGPP